jgi:TfoX/Sxy family transcriptional regulator of competence genes
VKQAPKPRWRPAPPALVERFERALATLSGAVGRKMFGYPAGFLAGHMFTGLFQDTMLVRLSEGDRAELLQQPGAKTFEPMPGRPMREYVVVPPSVLGSATLLATWLEKALVHARTLPPKRPNPTSTRPKKPKQRKG